MPPAKIVVATIIYEFEIVANAYGRTIDREIFEENFVLRPLVVPGERERTWEQPHPCGRFAAIPGCVVSQRKQSTFNLNHAAHARNRSRRRLHRRVKLIAEQML